jgi:hypothetical protein
MASRLHALSGHVTQRMCRALHLGVQKSLGMVASHYRVDLEAIVGVLDRQPTKGSTRSR